MDKREKFATVILLGVVNCVFLFAIPGSELAGEEHVGIGKRIPAFTLKDQHGKEGAVNGQVRLVLFCRERKGSDIVGEALQGTSASYLSQHQAVFVADTSGMPRLIAKFAALPALRKKPFRVFLDPGPSVTKNFPSAKDEVTLLFLKNLTIYAVKFVDNPVDVRKAIEEKGREN